MTPAPGYDGRPVILVHLGHDWAPHLAFCSGTPFERESALHQGVPRILCPGCARGSRLKATHGLIDKP